MEEEGHVGRRPRYVVVRFGNVEYELDMVVCEHALFRQQMAGRLENMQALADEVNISRSTASRFFGGRPTSIRIIRLILARLQLSFDDVAKRIDHPNGSAPPDTP